MKSRIYVVQRPWTDEWKMGNAPDRPAIDFSSAEGFDWSDMRTSTEARLMGAAKEGGWSYGGSPQGALVMALTGEGVSPRHADAQVRKALTDSLTYLEGGPSEAVMLFARQTAASLGFDMVNYTNLWFARRKGTVK